MRLIKQLGGFVRSHVSGKTDYLVCGPRLINIDPTKPDDNQRPYWRGDKHKAAVNTFTDAIILISNKMLYGLCFLLINRKNNVDVDVIPEYPLIIDVKEENDLKTSVPFLDAVVGCPQYAFEYFPCEEDDFPDDATTKVLIPYIEVKLSYDRDNVHKENKVSSV